jgi:hypothetical protein
LGRSTISDDAQFLQRLPADKVIQNRRDWQYTLDRSKYDVKYRHALDARSCSPDRNRSPGQRPSVTQSNTVCVRSFSYRAKNSNPRGNQALASRK